VGRTKSSVYIPARNTLTNGYNESIFWDNDDNLNKTSQVVLKNVALIEGKIHLYQLDAASTSLLKASVRQYKQHVKKRVSSVIFMILPS
jgi:hypothetical protein